MKPEIKRKILQYMYKSSPEFLRKYQRHLHLYQILFVLVGLVLMFFGIFWFPEFVPYCAIGVMFALARNDFLYHRINNYLSSGTGELFESWLKKFQYTKFAMPVLDLFSFTPIIYLFIYSLNRDFTLPSWAIVALFFVSVIAIPVSVKIGQIDKHER